MKAVTERLATGPLVGLAVGVGDGAVAQAQIADRHGNVRSVYRFGVLAVGAIVLATARTPWRIDAGIAAMTAAAALVGSRVVPAIQGGGWQQFGYTAQALVDQELPVPPRYAVDRALDRKPEYGFPDPVKESSHRTDKVGYQSAMAPGLL